MIGIGRSSHLREDRLFDCYLSVRAGEALDPPAAEHLTECAACSARFDELTQFMDGLREDADQELDAVFTADVLRQQQQRIARRVASVGRSARVIHFPSPATAAAPAVRKRTALPRWAAATAAAGLFVGVAAGLFFREGDVPTPSVSAPAALARGQGATVPELVPTAADSDRDDLFLTELEVAAGGPRTAELAAFDALTPQIREVSLSMPIR
jgi:hypothetical protein